MAVPPIVIKLLATAATDKRTWKFAGIIIAAILSPIILVIFAIVVLLGGTAESNISILDCCFFEAAPPENLSEEQTEAIEIMQTELAELSEQMDEYESDSLDENLVKAVFYCIRFGAEAEIDENGEEVEFDYELFLECMENVDEVDTEEISDNLSESFPEMTIMGNRLMAIQNVYKYLNERSN